MWPVLLRFLNLAPTRLTLPLAVITGFIGYMVEGFISDKYTPPIPSVQEEREKRMLEEPIQSDSLKEKKFVPKTIFEKNLSPSLQEDIRGKRNN